MPYNILDHLVKRLQPEVVYTKQLVFQPILEHVMLTSILSLRCVLSEIANLELSQSKPQTFELKRYFLRGTLIFKIYNLLLPFFPFPLSLGPCCF